MLIKAEVVSLLKFLRDVFGVITINEALININELDLDYFNIVPYDDYVLDRNERILRGEYVPRSIEIKK